MEKPVVFMLQDQSEQDEPQERQKRRSKDRKNANDSGNLPNRDERMFIVLLIAFFIAAALLIALIIVFTRSLTAPLVPQAPLAPPDVAWNLAETSLSIWNKT